ncbi:MAG: hypothetical protein AB7S70_02290 [Hyphomicrobium sp.]|uniref:tetratricopeptide repeat protein n=1 Tax=Hyphomicrobium sp. TaxID=82 RepID=UPI003D1295A4
MTGTITDGKTATDREAVRAQLERILVSSAFAQSDRRQRFLTYVVEETLAGRGDRLKGYTIALEVFDRPKTFDAAVDPVVRIEAGRLRDKLREYYDSAGRRDPIVIELPKGTYTPTISAQRSFSEATPPPQVAAAEPASHSAIAAGGAPSPARWQVVAAAGAAALVMLAPLATWLTRTAPAPTPTDKAELALPKGPTIAVLPFANLSGDPKQDYFSDGLTEDILTELARARGLRVLARNTTFQLKGKAEDVTRIGRELNARYVLEGSVRRTGDRLRVTAQLIATDTGTHIWAERFDRELADVLLVQDEIVTEIAGKVAGGYGVIESSEAKEAARKSPAEVEAYDLVLRARDIMRWDWTADNFRRSRETLNQAIALDPANAAARRELAWFAIIGWVFRFEEKPLPLLDIRAEAAKAVQIDPADARGHMVAASAYFFARELDLFRHESEQALALAPYDAEIMAVLACMISSAGDHDRGVTLANRANALNADATIGWYHTTIYTADYLKGDYEHALEIARQNIQDGAFYAHLEIIPIYGQLGRTGEAREAWAKLRQTIPDASAATFESWWRLWNIHDDEVARLMDGVYKSGVLVSDTRPVQ